MEMSGFFLSLSLFVPALAAGPVALTRDFYYPSDRQTPLTNRRAALASVDPQTLSPLDASRPLMSAAAKGPG